MSWRSSRAGSQLRKESGVSAHAYILCFSTMDALSSALEEVLVTAGAQIHVVLSSLDSLPDSSGALQHCKKRKAACMLEAGKCFAHHSSIHADCLDKGSVRSHRCQGGFSAGHRDDVQG